MVPQTERIAFIVLGGFLILIGVLGGNFKLFGGEVADKVSNRFLRFVAFMLGAILITLAAVPPSANNEGFQSKWTCYNKGNSVGDVTIEWGHTQGAAEWACNQWISTCGNNGGCIARKISK